MRMPDHLTAERERTLVAAGSQGRTLTDEFKNVDELAEMLRVLADPTRIRLIKALEQHGRSTVTALTSVLPVSQQSVSHQLGILRAAGVVSRHREGAWVHYELSDWSGPWVLHQLAEALRSD
jgi:DNA-binding transcriptional ArsR family regulator